MDSNPSVSSSSASVPTSSSRKAASAPKSEPPSRKQKKSKPKSKPAPSQNQNDDRDHDHPLLSPSVHSSPQDSLPSAPDSRGEHPQFLIRRRSITHLLSLPSLTRSGPHFKHPRSASFLRSLHCSPPAISRPSSSPWCRLSHHEPPVSHQWEPVSFFPVSFSPAPVCRLAGQRSKCECHPDHAHPWRTSVPVCRRAPPGLHSPSCIPALPPVSGLGHDDVPHPAGCSSRVQSDGGHAPCVHPHNR